MKQYLHRAFRHADWGNRRVYEMIEVQNPVNERAIQLLGHILASERVWITRLHGIDSTTLPIWPDWSLAECEGVLDENRVLLHEIVTELSESDLASSTITYRNSKGQEFTTLVLDVLSHVAFHGTYHRGQIAATVRNAGEEPVNTDFITFVRERDTD